MVKILSQAIKNQWLLWLLALSFFTRIPVRLPEKIASESFHQSSRYFALVGLLLGLCLAVIYWGLSLLLPIELAILLMMAASLLLTGAFHEDGWADVWDGFGGGWSVEQKLNIMKDSRLGTYGAAALFILLMIKFQSLTALAELSHYWGIACALVIAHTVSRALATSLIWHMPYVSEDATSKAKPVVKALSLSSLAILLISGVVVLFLLLAWQQALLMLACLVLMRALLMRWFNGQLGGYTGDCLGAAQQLSEVFIYLLLLIFGSKQWDVLFSQPLFHGYAKSLLMMAGANS